MSSSSSASRRRCHGFQMTMVDWSQLPYDIVALIANKLHTIEDFISFSAVCHSWQFIYRNKDWTPTRRVPLLMVDENHSSDVCARRFISMWKNKVYKLPLPMAHGRRCWGSTHGWIVTVDQNLVISLLNPVSQVCFDLPPHSTLENQVQSLQSNIDWFSFIHKAAVFKIRDVFVTMIIYGQDYRLAFHRHHEGSAWLPVPANYIRFIDVVCFGNQVFALCMTGRLFLVEIDSPHLPRIIFLSSLPPDQNSWQQKHLVHSSGQLLLIFHDPYQSYMIKFKVYRFDFESKAWVVLQSLGESVLFVDDSQAFSILAGDDFKSNSIYFAVENLRWLLGMEENYEWEYCGVYHMEDETTETFLLKMSSVGEVFPHYISPTWLIPTLS
ncbi:hypothetical protein LguiB_033394 [Lonicera macranthoides]